MSAQSLFTKSLSVIAIAAALGLSMGTAQARDFDHRAAAHGFQHVDHRSDFRHGHRARHHRDHRHHYDRRDGRR